MSEQSTKLRYFVTKPVKGGYAFFDVRDRQGLNFPNEVLVSIFKRLPRRISAARLAKDICDKFNLADRFANIENS